TNDRGEYADQGELLLLILDVVERQRIHQAERRHVTEVVKKKQPDKECWSASRLRYQQHDDAAQQMERPKHSLRREVAIGNQAKAKWRNTGGDGIYLVC